VPTFRAVDATAATAATTITATLPTGTVSGDLLLLPVVTYPSTTAPTIAAGAGDAANWAQVATATGGNGADGVADSGNRRITVFRWTGATAPASAPTVTNTGGTITAGRMHAYAPTLAGATYDVTSATGTDSTAGVDYSATMGSNPGLTTGDLVFVALGLNTNGGGSASRTVTATGATVATPTSRLTLTTALSFHARVDSADSTVTAGTSTAAPVVNATYAAAVGTTAPAGPAVLIRVRELAAPVITTSGSRAGVEPGSPVTFTASGTSSRGVVTITWTKVSGPGTLSANSGGNVTVTVPAALTDQTTVLRASGTDGTQTSTADVTLQTLRTTEAVMVGTTLTPALPRIVVP
jgi:hypothetical protein